jgi:serine/threonine-protein kinase
MRLGSSIRRRRDGDGKGFSLRGLFPGGEGGGSRKKEAHQARKPGSEGRWWSLLTEPKGLAALLLLGVLGFGGGYLISTKLVYPLPPPPGDLKPVPDLSGERPEDVADTLSALGLTLGSVDSLAHPSIQAGTIVGQSPLPGQLYVEGDTVRIALSTGPERRPVPDVLRLQGEWARTILETSGFVVSVDSVESEDPRGNVVEMRPEAGTSATIPMEVSISVSMGPPEFEMPLLLGLPEEQARSILDSLGLLLIDVETRFRFGRDQGMVVEQEPPSGTKVQEGSDVRLVVGRRGL